jgi:hypothetical protein
MHVITEIDVSSPASKEKTPFPNKVFMQANGRYAV